jgi:hypothetical protein
VSLPREPRTRRAPSLSTAEWHYFIDDPLPSEKTWRTPDHWTNYRLSANRDLGDGQEGYAERRWRDVEGEVLTWWVANHPGTRPSTWWRYSAPERPRLRETEHRYLDRLGLWLAGERERVSA